MYSFIFLILVIAIIAAISWAVTCGILWLIALCFGLAFSLKIATGIWLVMFLISTIFNKGSSSTKK